MAATATTGVELDSTAEVLSFARARRADAQAAEADVFAAAAGWAEQHPAESVRVAATWAESAFGDAPLMLAGPGAPLVAEFCIAELAAAWGMTTDAGRSLVADAVETKYRLPRVWGRVMTGSLPTWRARRIAQATMSLSLEAARFVDARIAPHAHKVGPVVTDRMVTEATVRFMPEKAVADAEQAAEGRHVRFHHRHVSFNGTTCLDAELDLADALDFDAALAQGAEWLRAAGCEQPLEVRRAMAVGELARRQLGLDLRAAVVSTSSTDDVRSTDDPGSTDDVRSPVERIKARQVVLYVHLPRAALTGTGENLDLARVENHRQVVTADQVRTWCANPDTQVTVKPVIDLAEQLSVEAYEIPDRFRERAELRDHTCVFPWCTRPARQSDIDHVDPYGPDGSGGPTATVNLAPLCRRHHRLKTHDRWSYLVIEPGVHLWTSPHGYRFLRDHTGTRDTRPPHG